MLEDSGSQQIPNTRKHKKWRLPSGEILTLPSTPSGGNRSNENALSLVRRKLRPTNPEVANRGWNIPKEKRSPERTLAAQLLGVLPSIPAIVAVPGAEQTSKYPPLPLVRLPDATPLSAMTVIPAVPEPQQPVYHRIPRAPSRTRVAPQPVKTLTDAQLAEANRILRADGDKAMQVYLNQCRDGLVSTSIELQMQRVPITIDEKYRVAPRSIPEESDLMANVLERARLELQSTTARIAECTKTIERETERRDFETERQLKLEQYIERHERFAMETADLLQEILPEVKAEPIVKKDIARSKRPTTYRPRLEFATKDLVGKVLPHMRAQGLTRFNSVDLMVAAQAVGVPMTEETRKRAFTWLHPLVKAGKVARDNEVGYFMLPPGEGTK